MHRCVCRFFALARIAPLDLIAHRYSAASLTARTCSIHHSKPSKKKRNWGSRRHDLVSAGLEPDFPRHPFTDVFVCSSLGQRLLCWTLSRAGTQRHSRTTSTHSIHHFNTGQKRRNRGWLTQPRFEPDFPRYLCADVFVCSSLWQRLLRRTSSRAGTAWCF